MLRLEGQCSIPSMSSIFKHFDFQPSSVGYLSESLRDYGRCVPSTLSMPHQKVVFYLSDEIFAIRAPILVTIDAQSTAILKIELASDRSAQTWEAHFKCSCKINFMFITKIFDEAFDILDQMTKALIGPKFDPFIFHKTP